MCGPGIMAFLVDAVRIFGPTSSASSSGGSSDGGSSSSGNGSGSFVSAVAVAVLGSRAAAQLGCLVSAAFGQAQAANLLIVGVTWLQARAAVVTLNHLLAVLAFRTLHPSLSARAQALPVPLPCRPP